MGDVGYFDEGGRLWYCGRKKHRVVLGDRTLFTIPIERMLDGGSGYRTALVGIDGPQGREAALLVHFTARCFYPIGPHGVLRRIEDGLAGDDRTNGITHVLQRGPFPVDPRHNAKIRRELLSDWAQKKLYG